MLAAEEIFGDPLNGRPVADLGRGCLLCCEQGSVAGFRLAARMSADQRAEYNIEINEISAAMAPVLERLTCPVRYVLATGASLGAEGEEMKQMRSSLDPVLARKPNLTVSPKVASNHSKILRNDYRAIADAISGLTAALPPADS